MDTSDDGIPKASRVIGLLGWAMVGGVGVGLAFALQAASPSRFFAALGVVAATAGAATVCGALLGFVFGIPRSLQGSSGGASGNTPAAQGHGGDAQYGANTSLEQISDWLTKILVGVGLTQLTQVPGALESYSTFIGAALPDMLGSTVFVGALTLHSAACGFLASYLWTRLKLGEALSKADVLTRAEFEREKQSNALALQLVEQQLHRGMPPPDGQQLNDAIGAADDLYRAHIFELARRERRDAEERKDVDRVKKTIPIFSALIRRNPDAFHQTYGQLGYALLAVDPPDHDGCESNLSRAIELRKDWHRYGYPLYELTRALSRIMRKRGPDGKPTRAEAAERERILADFKVLTNLRWGEMGPEQQALVRDWAAANDAVEELDERTHGELRRLGGATAAVAAVPVAAIVSAPAVAIDPPAASRSGQG